MKYLVIDCDAICWAVYHSLPEMSFEKMRTEIIYGFLNKLFYFQEFDKADRIILAWDSKFSERLKLYPHYKHSRRSKRKDDKSPQEVKEDKMRRLQFKLLRTRILPKLGFRNIFHQPGYEGDDIIASVAFDSSDHYVKMVARDKDLYQLISNTCVMYDWVEGRLITMEWLFDAFGVYSDIWPEVMSISGCSTDDVPGIDGVSHKTAIKFLHKKLNPNTKTYKKIVNGCDEIEMSRLLTNLPFEGTRQFTVCKDVCEPRLLKEVAREYGLKSYLSRLREFKELFCGTTTQGD